MADNGHFSFKTIAPETADHFSVGYNEYVRLIHPAKSSQFNITLLSAAADGGGDKRGHRPPKDNPADEVARR